MCIKTYSAAHCVCFAGERTPRAQDVYDVEVDVYADDDDDNDDDDVMITSAAPTPAASLVKLTASLMLT